MDHQAVAQLLGNYGEFLGSIGVLATLIYLAIQVRQGKKSMDANTRVVKAQISQARADNATAMLRGVAHSDQLARIGAAGLSASDKVEWVKSLSPEDRYRWCMHLLSQFNDIRNEFYQYQQGFLDEKIWNTSTRGQITRVLADLPYFLPANVRFPKPVILCRCTFWPVPTQCRPIWVSYRIWNRRRSH